MDSTVLRVAEADLRRALAKRATIFVVILFILPLIAAAALRYGLDVEQHANPTLWATIMGVDIASTEMHSEALISLAGIASWWWLVVSLYSGDLFAADFESGAVRLILARPVTRSEYVVGKIISILGLLTILSVLGGLSIYAAARIIGGPQEGLATLIGVSMVLVLGAVPLLLTGALVGGKMGKATTGIIVAILIYIVVRIVAGMVSTALLFAHGGGNLIEMGLKANSLVPFDGGKTLGVLVYSYHQYGPVYTPPYSYEITPEGSPFKIVVGPIDLGKLLVLNLVSTLSWIVLLMLAAIFVIKRKDF